MATEYLEVFDGNNIPTGIKKLRADIHTEGDWHRTSNAIIINLSGDILCHKRGKTEDIRPNYWQATFGGHVKYMHTYDETIISEIAEELGINVRIEDLKPLGIFDIVEKSNQAYNREHSKYFTLTMKKDIPLGFNNEVIDLKYFSASELIDISEGKRNDSIFSPFKVFLKEFIRKQSLRKNI